MEISEEQYIEAFNRGYTLRKVDPTIYATISKSHNSRENQTMQAFIAGGEQYELEQEHSVNTLRRRSELDNARNEDRDRNEQDREF